MKYEFKAHEDYEKGYYDIVDVSNYKHHTIEIETKDPINIYLSNGNCISVFANGDVEF